MTYTCIQLKETRKLVEKVLSLQNSWNVQITNFLIPLSFLRNAGGGDVISRRERLISLETRHGEQMMASR